MGRRTAGWRTWARRGRPSAHARVAAAGMVLSLCTAAILTGPSAWAADTPNSYAFAADARSVTGATRTTDAERLQPGATYRSSLPADGKIYYRLTLDAASTAYVSATAVPGPGTSVSATDGIRVSIQDANSRFCSRDTASIGAGRSPRPITALGVREASPGGALCQGSGTYFVVVERVRRADSPADAWDLELAPVSEPPAQQGGATSAPEGWNSASPEPPTGEPESRPGGAGFDTATSIGQGVWNSDIRPGQTLFYEVPVDWGRQLYATAELGSSSSGDGFVPSALAMSLYNPVRGYVDDAGVAYDGSQRSAALQPLPPVEYRNRHAVSDKVSGMRFAGSYYLVVHLAERMADEFGDGPFGLTLRVRVEGAAQSGPGYAGQSEPQDVFEVTAQEREAAEEGGTAAAGSGTAARGGGEASMKVIAAGGIGAGTVLLVVLGAWTVMGRRRAGA
ncbi:hypothetical protein [Streptomyces sp. NL15-2K]|uniref:hypothetical protein n=1 Tax=Streptomyces sp. NL15-2K TaxID=376149 RepID=UPI000F58ADA6|nr:MULTISPECIES: hypothetical protein [Actinomycetes]WKX10753.1 hypothetical protein Q4V64_25920 [Kutzneria buriramensis]